MWSKNFSKTGKYVALMLGQLIVLMLCVVYIEHAYYTNILPDKQANETFRQTTCFLISKKLTTKGELDHRYRADFLISYNVNGAQYNRWVSGNGLDMSFSGSHNRQETVLNQYTVGKTYVCWFNPIYPQLALLVQRHNWMSTFPLMVPAVVFIIMLYYFLKNLNLLVLLGANIKKRRQGK